jgi:L-iditol 2-dehydrogenase
MSDRTTDGTTGNRVARLHAARDVRMHQEDAPRPADGETLVRITAVGICGSDLHWFEEGGIGSTGLSHALCPGHEFAGVTADGRRVAVEPAVPCGTCELCLEGHPNLCESVRFAGYDEDGALREWMAWPERCLFELPDVLTDAEGAMLEPLGVALHAVDLAHIRPGMTVGVFGSGPIGWLLIQVAKFAGAGRIVATDLASRPHRLDAARRLGADVVAADGGREGAAIRQLLGGRGLDVALEAAGEDEAIDAAVDAVRPGARIVLAGIPATLRSSFSASTARRKGLTFAMVRRMKHTYPRAIRLVRDGLIDVRSCITHRFPLEQTAAAFESAARREGLKVIVEP